MGAIKGGLIGGAGGLGGRHKEARHESNHPENLCVGGTDGQQPAGRLSRAGFGVITLLAIALFGWANPVF